MPTNSRLNQLRYTPGGGTYRIIATAESTNNSFFALEETSLPGGGTPLHCHTREDEFFHILEGQLTLYVDGKIITLNAGQSLFAPRNIPHCFKNCSNALVKFLVFCTPPAIEAFFDYGTPLPAPASNPPSDEHLIHQLMSLAPQFGLQLLGPSPL